MRWFTWFALAVFAGGIALGASWSAAADFRFENRVFVPGQEEPVSRSTTLFHEGAVYDYLEGYPEITVLDKEMKVFTLLDTRRRLRTELTTSEVRMLCERLGNMAAASNDPFTQFLANPKFDEIYDAASGQLRLQSEWLEYRLATAPASSPDTAKQYRLFSDLSAQLNTAITPGSRPPQARMLVNAALERLELVPREVSRVTPVKKGSGAKTVSVRSEHQFNASLSEADTNRIKQTLEYMRIFTRVSYAEYQQHGPEDGTAAR